MCLLIGRNRRFLFVFLVVVCFVFCCSSCLRDKKRVDWVNKVTWTQHIRPVFYKHCMPCHNANGVAPFALNTYSQVQKRADAIRYVIQTGYMPPWKPDPSYSSFVNESILLSKEEIALINTWIETGKAEGPFMQAKPYNYPLFAKNHLSPVIVLRPDTVFYFNAEEHEYQAAYLFRNVTDTALYVSAINYQPGNAAITHHVWLLGDTTGQFNHFDKNNNLVWRSNRLFADLGINDQKLTINQNVYLPGWQNTPLASGTVYYIPAHADLLVQVHYAVKSRYKTSDFFSLEFYPSTNEPRKVIHCNTYNHPDIFIAAGAKKTFVYRSPPLDSAIDLRRIQAHMHYRGLWYKAYVITPNNDTLPVIRINKWDVRLQGAYVLKNPLYIPAHSVFCIEGEFDNTTKNMMNPVVPPVDVYEGMNSVDEMLGLGTEFTFH